MPKALSEVADPISVDRHFSTENATWFQGSNQ